MVHGHVRTATSYTVARAENLTQFLPQPIKSRSVNQQRLLSSLLPALLAREQLAKLGNGRFTRRAARKDACAATPDTLAISSASVRVGSRLATGRRRDLDRYRETQLVLKLLNGTQMVAG